MRGYAEACRYMAVNKEAEALCYLGILDLHGRQIMYPETSSFPKGVKLPRISPQRAMEALELLKKEGVPYAEYVLQKPRSPGSPSDKEKSLQLLAERYPYSLGGALAAGELAVILWQKGRYPEALRMAQPLVGIIPNAGGVVAWAEFTGQGARQNRESACRKAQFWSVRFPVSPATYTLGLCYLEGVGGLPKDPLEAYALFWLANYLGCCHPGLEQALKGLESSLTPAQALEARRRAVRYLP
ncbi:MAG: hypothetical protein ACK4G4_12345 [Thermus sp.]|uniref:hypothetical protein n=1 Tax=Thermus sp. TaxID=275 RepID=UPI00391DD85B